jgi:hypothetical protein
MLSVWERGAFSTAIHRESASLTGKTLNSFAPQGSVPVLKLIA